MAVVKTLQQSKRKTFHVQPTAVVCHYAVFKLNGGKRLLQLDTFGSVARKMPRKVSQTLQFDETQAKVLWTLLGREFEFG
jgi:hypothetical protein